MLKAVESLSNRVLFYREVALKKGSFNKVVTDYYSDIKKVAYESYHSNQIEGNKVTLGNTERILLAQDRENIYAQHSKNDVLEVVWFAKAIRLLVEFLQRKLPLSEDLIKMLHREMTKGVTLFDAGRYRKHDVKPSGSDKVVYNRWQDVERDMTVAVNSYLKKDKNLFSILDFKLDFILIHPFGDGNGRISRLLLNYLLIQNGFIPIVIKLSERDEYIATLQKASKGNYNDFYIFICKKLLDEYKKIIG